MRAPLLGIYALQAEWRALMDPATPVEVAGSKLPWWRDEVRRMAAGTPLHPITRYLSELPNVPNVSLGILEGAVEATAAQVAGVPLERAGELAHHANALYGTPLLVAVQLAHPGDAGPARACIEALAAAEYLARAIADYVRDARAGRVPFPVDELLAAGIENDALVADRAPPRLQAYLDAQRRRAAEYFSAAPRALLAAERPALRHLAVLAALGAAHLHGRRNPSSADFRLADLYNAWNAARRAAAAR